MVFARPDGGGGSRPVGTGTVLKPVNKQWANQQASANKAQSNAKVARGAAQLAAPLRSQTPSSGSSRGTGGGGGSPGGSQPFSYVGPFSGATFGGAGQDHATGGAPRDIDWLRGNDGEFQAAEAAYKNAFDQLIATVTRENANYETDYGTGLQNLGWRDDTDDGVANPTWATQNVDTAAGRAFRNLFDDFASRGMLQGSAFAESENTLRTNLQQQLDQLNEGRGQFLKAQDEKKTQAGQTRDNSVKLAAAQALARLGSGLTAV